MTVRLLNSAVMPVEGVYRLHRLSAGGFAHQVKLANSRGELESYIGYPQTAEHVSRLAGVPIPVNRAQTPLENGDVILIVRLQYRVPDPASKGEAVPEEFEYFVCGYSTETDDGPAVSQDAGQQPGAD